MRAAVYNEPERPLPLAGTGQVRVRIVLSAVNPAGTGTWAGQGVPNQDGAGVVDAVGEGVRGLEPGDHVWVWGAGADGTAQEYLVLPRRQVVRLNDDVPFEVGAALGIPALTAHRCLTAAAGGPPRLRPGALRGRTVLVAGGTGAVGSAAIQLAEWAGATVLATAAGADEVRHGDVAGPVIIVGIDTCTTTAEEEDDAVEAVAEAANSGAFRVGEDAGLPIIRFPFAEVAAAVEAHSVGRVVIEVTAP